MKIKTVQAFFWKASFLVMLMSFFSFAASLQAGIWDSIKSTFVASEKLEPPKIRVLIVHNVDAAVIEVKGKYNIYDPLKNNKLGSYFLGKSNLLQPLSGGLKWGEEFPGVYQINIIPDDPNITTLVDGIEYKGNLYVYDIGGRISIVNEVDIEDYVSSVLGSTIDKPLSEEALAAAAIAARTQAYRSSLTASNPFWHIEAKQSKYQGNGVTGRFKEVEKAIVATRYMVMSQTGAYDRVLTPVAVQIIPSGKVTNSLSLAEAEALAQKGDNAAKILNRTFPNTTIQLTHNFNDSTGDIAEIEKTR